MMIQESSEAARTLSTDHMSSTLRQYIEQYVLDTMSAPLSVPSIASKCPTAWPSSSLSNSMPVDVFAIHTPVTRKWMSSTGVPA